MYQWIDDVAALNAWLAPRRRERIIGLDTEFMRTNTFRARLALVQINVDGEVAVLDSPQLGSHGDLGARLAASDCVCVIHSSSEDLEAMVDILPDGPANLFDTQIAAAMAGLGFGLSYQKLVSTLLGIDLPKAETRSDWLARPLSAAQLDYAAQDVEHMPEIYRLLDEKLAMLGRREWLAEDCRRLVERVCHPIADLQPQRAFRTASDWPVEQRVLLRRILLWRESNARTLDKPRSWILDDAHALEFASRPPVDTHDLFERSKGLRALRGPQRNELFDVLRAPPQPDELDATPIPPPFTPQQRRQLQAWRDAIAAIAQRENIPEGLLCSRRHLESLLTDGVWPAALDGWRKPLLFDSLSETR
ncbi:MAG: ribonuclease D [Rudaea sp.]